MIFYYFNDMFSKLCWCYVVYNIHARVYRGLVHVFGHSLSHIIPLILIQKRDRNLPFPSNSVFMFIQGTACNC